MILGRPTNLILGAFTALFNVIVLVGSATGSYAITPELVAAINLAAGAVITLVANQPPTLNTGDKLNVITPAGEPNKTITV